MLERLESAMKKFSYRFLLLTILCLAAPAQVMSEPITSPFSSPFTRFGSTDPRIAPYMPKFEQKPIDRPSRPPHWPNRPPHWWQGSYLLFPYSGCCQDDTPEQVTASPPPRPAPRPSIELNPAIFNPEPKAPLTLIIEDGVVVDRYRGY
jgi:hypothetical protein